jgi:hypothetical protein
MRLPSWRILPLTTIISLTKIQTASDASASNAVDLRGLKDDQTELTPGTSDIDNNEVIAEFKRCFDKNPIFTCPSTNLKVYHKSRQGFLLEPTFVHVPR